MKSPDNFGNVFISKLSVLVTFPCCAVPVSANTQTKCNDPECRHQRNGTYTYKSFKRRSEQTHVTLFTLRQP